MATAPQANLYESTPRHGCHHSPLAPSSLRCLAPLELPPLLGASLSCKPASDVGVASRPQLWSALFS